LDFLPCVVKLWENAWRMAQRASAWCTTSMSSRVHMLQTMILWGCSCGVKKHWSSFGPANSVSRAFQLDTFICNLQNASFIRMSLRCTWSLLPTFRQSDYTTLNSLSSPLQSLPPFSKTHIFNDACGHAVHWVEIYEFLMSQ
jgi:hypothetical protein